MRLLTREHVLKKNDVCVHIFSRFGRVRNALAHRDTEESVVALQIPSDRYKEVVNANSWLEVAAILRRKTDE